MLIIFQMEYVAEFYQFRAGSENPRHWQESQFFAVCVPHWRPPQRAGGHGVRPQRHHRWVGLAGHQLKGQPQLTHPFNSLINVKVIETFFI